MKVSVIVPVWGVEKYLDKCLDSLVHQTIPVKVIVVNDSSPDHSQLIIDRYKDTYPDLIDAYIKPNGGIADVRNFGLSKVTTPFWGNSNHRTAPATISPSKILLPFLSVKPVYCPTVSGITS